MSQCSQGLDVAHLRDMRKLGVTLGLAAVLFFAPLYELHATITRAPRDLPMREGANTNLPISVIIRRDQKIKLLEPFGPMTKVKVKIQGKVRTGYILTRDLSATELPAERDWAFGLGASIGQLSQRGKTFETEDQVRYETTKYISQTTSPFLIAQHGQKNFWRVALVWRIANFSGQAANSVSPTASKELNVRHQMFGLTFDRTWNLLSWWPPFYIGLGAEISRATSTRVRLGEQTLPTSSQDKPVYLGGRVLVGAGFTFWDRFYAFTEFRVSAFPNQSPTVYGYEPAAAVMMWF